MSQHSVTVVIPVWNQWAFTKPCLETLKPTLGVRDKVIVVDNGSDPQTQQGLKHFPWVTLITNEEDRGFAAACNQGAAAATGDIVVFLNNDTILPSRWLDGLIEPFSDENVYATGPMANEVAGSQQVTVEYLPDSVAEMRRFARNWREDHRHQTTEVTRLASFCIAVRRDRFEAVGGFEEDSGLGGFEADDLCLRLVEAGGRLLICHETFVHHHGDDSFYGNSSERFELRSANFKRFRDRYSSRFGLGAYGPDSSADAVPANTPLLSACMIVKNEGDMLARCLEALYGLVDEVVIYDTGSTDNTVGLAVAMGARVVEGYWDDDFGRARNAALAECTGEWVLHIDADEVVEGQKEEFRSALVNLPTDGFQVSVVNLGKANINHRPVRAFKRSKYHWAGRLHEQVVPRDGSPRTALPVAPGIELKHYGYLPEMVESRNKADRNIRIAQLELDKILDGDDRAEKLSNLGRSYTIAGRHQEALDILSQARSEGNTHGVTMRTILRAGAQACMAVDDPEQALEWIDEFQQSSMRTGSSRFLRTLALADLKRWEDALAESDGLTDLSDDDGVEFPMNILRHRRAYSFAMLGEWEGAAEEITYVAQSATHEEAIWGLVAESYWRTNRDLRDVLSRVPAHQFNSLLAQLSGMPVEAADLVLDTFYADDERRSKVLALAVRVAPALSAERSLEWSARFRSAGMDEFCPLVARARDEDLSDTDRLQSAAMAFAAFADERVPAELSNIAAACAVEHFQTALVDLDALAPALLESFIIGVSTDAERSFAMAQVLYGFGAADEAVAVLMHGLGNEGGQRIGAQAAAWLEEVGRPAEAAGVRSALS